MKSLGPQIMDAMERRIAADEATSQETHHAHVYESIQCSTAKAGEDGLAEHINDNTQAQDIPKVSAPEVYLIIWIHILSY